MNIADVARAAGVSQTTVSHTLSGKRPVAEATRQRILALIEELGFRPSEVARSLRTQRTNTIALIIPDIANPFYPELARGLQDVVDPSQMQVFICNTDGLAHSEADFLDLMAARGVDGMVTVSFHLKESDFDSVTKAGIALVRLGDYADEGTSDTVATAQQTGMAEATGYLVGRGRRRIAFIDAPHGLNGLGQRFDGYCDGLRAAGLPLRTDYVVETGYTRAGGRTGMATLLQVEPRPDAVLCANDLVAIGALDVLRDARIRVPEEMAVVGFDDIEAASMVSPALTTVRNRAYEMGRTAGQLLISRLVDAYDGPKRHIVLPTDLVSRESA